MIQFELNRARSGAVMNRVPSLEYVSVSKDAYDFLKHMLFGAWNSIYVAASERAYRDICRTLRNIRQTDTNSTKLRSEIDILLEQEICALLDRGIANQKQYDEWHEKLCLRIRKHYHDNGFEMTIGQAQKWVNMTMKYLFIADAPGMVDAFYFCHVPIDSYIINAAEEQLALKRPVLPWSKIDSYNEYAKYQQQIRMLLSNIAPLEWEFKTWITMAVDKKEAKHTRRAEQEMKK